MIRAVAFAIVSLALSGLLFRPAAASYECEGMFLGGWHVCFKDSVVPMWREVTAVPVEMLLDAPKSHQAFPALRCRGPEWWKPWGARRLSLRIESGNTQLPIGDFTLWLSYSDHSGEFSEFKGYRASGETDGRTHITIVAGDAAREIAHAARGLTKTMHWQYGQDDDHRYSIGVVTLRGPTSEVLAACPD